MSNIAALKVLLVLTSHAQLGDTGKPTGVYLPELAHAYDVFTKAGAAVDFASPAGGRPPIDGVNDADATSKAFLADRAVQARLERTLKPIEVNANAYDAIFYVGGHGTVWDLPTNTELAAIAARIYERGGVVSAVCHGPSALLGIRLANGKALVDGKRVAAFTNDEERAVGLDKVVPFLLADELVRRGATHVPAANWQPQVVTSERLVTGQNPASTKGVAEAVVGLLRARP